MMRLWLCLTLAPCTAFAWESVCTDAAGRPCSPSAGPQTARQRWLGPLDEHRQLFEKARAMAGLPEALSAEQQVTIFTSSATVNVAGQQVPSLRPVAFDQTLATATRRFSVPELAQLPDFSYALWDWANGHESCPLSDGTDPQLCHDFASHMGPVNSNHFAPQSQQFYTRYHALALARAAECKAMAQRLTDAVGRFDDYVRACEVEALSLEAVAQHFLQDAWSMGHMWERWGSARLDDFPGSTTQAKRDRAVLTALVSGFIHGARGVLQALPEWTTYDVNDAMCAPWPDVRFIADDGVISAGVGDDYLSTVSAEQSRRLFDCSASGLLTVYQATGQVHGPASPTAALSSVDPTSATCFGQRATNLAIVRGMAIQLKVVRAQITIPLDARFSSWLIPHVARSTGKVPVDAKTRNEFRHSLQRVTTMARLTAKQDPEGSSLATGAMGDFMGVMPNGAYATPADYEDPPLPWGPSGNGRATTLARAFHRAHAAQWCEAYDAAALSALKAHARDSSLTASEKAAACAACAEVAVRHLRIGTAASYDEARQPLCHYLATTPALLYASGAGEPSALAQQWCCN